MKTKLITIMTVLFLLVLLAATVPAILVKAQDPDPNAPVEASPPPGDNHFDVNFVTKRGMIAFTSTFVGTTTPTVPPFYWHDDFETETVGLPASKWTVVSGAWRVEYDGSNVYSVDRAVSPDVEAITVAGSTSWMDYMLKYKVKITEDGVEREGSAFVRADSTAWNGYLIAPVVGGADTGHVALWKRVSGGWTKLTTAYGGITPDTWHSITVVLQGNNIKVYVAGAPTTPTVDYTDTASPFLSGRIGLRLWDNRHAHFDDVTVLGKPMPGQSWIGDGPQYTETRTMSGPVAGPVISGTLDVSSTTILDVTTGSGTTTGTWTLTGASGGFEGTLSATNTNFGQLSGSFVSTSGSGFYAAQTVEGTFSGYFYESSSGSGQYDRFAATLTGLLTNPNEVLVGSSGTYIINFQWGSYFAILDDDATDGTPALVQLPGGLTMTGWYYEIFDQPRGKPETSVGWFYLYERVTGKPVWYAHFGPARGTSMNFNFRLHWDTWYPALWPGWPTTLTNYGCTNLATRWYYYDTFATAAP